MRFLSILFSLLIFSFSNVVISQSTLDKELEHSFSNYNLDQLATKTILSKVKSSNDFHSISLNLGGKTYQVEVWDSGLFADNYTLTLASGKEYEGTHPVALKGHLLGDPESSVRLTINDGFIQGYILSADKRLNIQPAYYYDSSADRNLVLSYYDKDMIESAEHHTCGTSEEMRIGERIEASSSSAKSIGQCFVVEISLATDWLMFQDYGSESAVENQIVGVLNDVQGNYDDEFADVIEYDLSDVWISDCNTCDPWTSSTDAGDLLDDFTAWGPGNLGGHQVASLWTSRNFDGPTIGLAWVGTVCTNFSYNVLEDFTSNASFLRVLQAHELGHNWDAGHDSSGGFIMSESVNASTTWSANSKSEIETYVTNNSGCFGTCSSGNPPTADFEYDIIENCVIGEVEFIDLSSIAATWFWTFEGGSPSTSTEQNPTVFYDNAGTFNVSLEVTNAAGEDFIELTNIIEISEGPVAFFEFETYELEVDFFDDSGAGNSAMYFWDFGDGNTSTDKDPLHEYLSPGVYDVTLVVEDECGEDEITLQVEVFDSPEAIFEANVLVVCPMDVVQFTDLSYGGIETWEWNFFGGSANDLAIANPTVTYSTPGLYNVSLKVTNPEGNDTELKQAYIEVLPDPQASFSYVVNNSQVTFTNNSTNANAYLWDFGDGTTSTDVSTVHTYSTSGTFSVTLSATSPCATVSETQSVTITLEPIADFSTSSTPSGCADLNLSFIDNSAGSPTSWSWSFPGGNPASSSIQNPTVVYSDKGSYTVTLVVTNAFGSNTITQPNYVVVDDLPELTANYTRNILTVNFTSTLVNGNGVLWDFGDGNTSTLANPVHTYNAAGTYSVIATSSNPCGTVSEMLTVAASSLPAANMTVSNSNICIGNNVTYTDNSSGGVVTREWTFPGGQPSTSTVANPQVSYSSTGSYNATLIVHNSSGSDTQTIENIVTVNAAPELTASFTRSILTANYMSTLVNGSGVEWNFGDGNTSNLANPTHTYAAPGTYNVSVTSSNNCGTDTENLTVTVNSLPSANFAGDNTNVCPGSNVLFSDNSTGGVITREWIFPGGSPSTSTLANPQVSYANSGTYDVTLNVTNDTGTDMITFTDYVTVLSVPTAQYDLNETGNQITVSANATNASSINWNISDGRSFSGSSQVIQFPENGTYTVTLDVANDCGTDESSFSVVVDVYPVSDFTSSTSGGCAPLSVNFMNNSPNATSYLWTFNGGTPSISFDANPTVTYNSEGNYDATLQVMNSFGSSTTSITDYIEISALPILDYNFDQNANELVLTNSSVGTNATWTISDGLVSNEDSFTHTFDSNGTYTVSLTVANSCGSEETSFDVVVDAYPTPELSIANTQGCVPFTVNYEETSSGNNSYLWTFEGGTPASSTDSSPTVVYDQAGTFDVTLDLTNDLGLASSVMQQDVIIVGDVPSVDVDVSVDNDGIITIINNTVGATSYSWEFGDGSTSTDVEPSYQYGNSGTYDLRLTVENGCGLVITNYMVEVDIISATSETDKAANWRISPNPSKGEFTLHHNLQDLGDWRYSVVDLRGVAVIEGQLEQRNNTESLFIEESGVYIVMLTNGHYTDVKRVVVIR